VREGAKPLAESMIRGGFFTADASTQPMHFFRIIQENMKRKIGVKKGGEGG